MNIRFTIIGLTLACGVAFFISCTMPPGSGGQGNGNASDIRQLEDLPDLRNERLRGVDDWAYQLQGEPVLDLEPIRQSAFDLVVIDYSADGSQDGEFTAEQIAALQSDPDNPKIVLAYVSVGEAELGRFYFDQAWISPDPDDNPDGPFTLTDSAPGFLAQPNPDFPDNFKVRYWLREWQEIIIANPGENPVIGDAKSYLDRIIDAGFDGVYLDIIDAFEFFGPADLTGGNGERVDAASLMIDFVIAIADHAKTTRNHPGFIVIVQNGTNVVEEGSFSPQTIPESQTLQAHVVFRRLEYFAATNGIGAEDSFYFGDMSEDNPLDPQADVIESLDRFRREGLLVLAIDYLTQSSAVDDFYNRARARGWVPYASTRDLDRLSENDPPPG